MVNRENEDLLDVLLERWEEAHEQGRGVSAEELCRDCPQLVDELSRRIEALKEMSALLDPDRPLIVMKNQGEPNPPSPSAPRILAGRYRLDERIAEGGFAQVWKGYDQELQRLVAVKIPKPSRLGSVEAFIAEARSVANLDHPSIVPIFDVGREGESCYLVFPFMKNGSLADLMHEHSMSPFDAAKYVAEVAEALSYAHEQGFVHRDIKPENILLDRQMRALLTDFGMAAKPDEADGSALGTLRYMSPEQVNGESVDGRSDYYSLGVVLFELLTGRLPYPSDDPAVLPQMIANGNLILEFPTTTDTELQRICRELLEREPERRHWSGGGLAYDLRQIWEVKATDVKMRKVAVENALNVGKKLFDKGFFEAAEEAYSEAIRLDPDCGEAYVWRGACKFERENVKASLLDFGRAIDLESHDEEARRFRALAYQSLGQLDSAITDLEVALELVPYDPAPLQEVLAGVYANRAACHSLAKRFDEAAADLTLAIKNAPTGANFHLRGSCHFKMMEYERAAADFTEAIKLEPTKATHYLRRVQCLKALGNERDAGADLEQAKRLNVIVCQNSGGRYRDNCACTMFATVKVTVRKEGYYDEMADDKPRYKTTLQLCDACAERMEGHEDEEVNADSEQWSFYEYAIEEL